MREFAFWATFIGVMVILALMLLGCAVPAPAPAGQPTQPTEQVWIARYCAATTDALRSAIRSVMGLSPTTEFVCDRNPTTGEQELRPASGQPDQVQSAPAPTDQNPLDDQRERGLGLGVDLGVDAQVSVPHVNIH